MIFWAEEALIEIRLSSLFHLLSRFYNRVGELIESLNNSYVISERSTQDVVDLLQVLSRIKTLLVVQMVSAEEEEDVCDCLWTHVNDVVFFQHQDLTDVIQVYKNVIQVMTNTLSSQQSASTAASVSTSAITTTTNTADNATKSALSTGNGSGADSRKPVQRQRLPLIAQTQTQVNKRLKSLAQIRMTMFQKWLSIVVAFCASFVDQKVQRTKKQCSNILAFFLCTATSSLQDLY